MKKGTVLSSWIAESGEMMAKDDSTTLEKEVALGRFHWASSEAFPGAVPGTASGSLSGGVSDKLPGLVLIHDVFGLSDHSRALAADLAEEGFGVLEINLYRGMGAIAVEDPGTHIRSLSDPEILSDLEAGADWLKAEPLCSGRKVGVIGVCMGGTYSLLAACLSDRFSAAAPFYGILSYAEGMLFDRAGRDPIKKPMSPIEAAGGLQTPLLASFGAEDAFVPNHDVAALRDGLATSGTEFDVDCYAGAGHAFLNRTRPAAYSETASHQAWARVIPFLHERLA